MGTRCNWCDKHVGALSPRVSFAVAPPVPPRVPFGPISFRAAGDGRVAPKGFRLVWRRDRVRSRDGPSAPRATETPRTGRDSFPSGTEACACELLFYFITAKARALLVVGALPISGTRPENMDCSISAEVQGTAFSIFIARGVKRVCKLFLCEQKTAKHCCCAAVFLLTIYHVLGAQLHVCCNASLPFQVFNMFRKDGPCRETIERVVLSARLAHVAAQLLGCER